MTRQTDANLDTFTDMARLQREAFESGIRRRADRLRKMAEDLDRIADRVGDVPTPGTKSYATLAGSAQHTVLWGLANLSLDSLTSDAYDADWAAAELTSARDAITGKEA